MMYSAASICAFLLTWTGACSQVGFDLHKGKIQDSRPGVLRGLFNSFQDVSKFILEANKNDVVRVKRLNAVVLSAEHVELC